MCSRMTSRRRSRRSSVIMRSPSAERLDSTPERRSLRCCRRIWPRVSVVAVIYCRRIEAVEGVAAAACPGEGGSRRRTRTKCAIARLKARERDRRKDWVEKTTTDLARRFDTIRVETLDVRTMTR
ncbi:MAG: transposase, partial [Mycobacterium sp.]